MVEERIVRSGRRLIGSFSEDERTFQIADRKSNIKEGRVKLPAKLFHEEIVGTADKLVIIQGEKKAYSAPLIHYWLSVHEFLSYATEIRGQYVVPLYSFKSRKVKWQ
jgi:hypothetical protein